MGQSIIGVIFVLADGDNVASTLGQDWYGKVFGEDIPAVRGTIRRMWWLGGVVGFIQRCSSSSGGT